MIRNLAQVNFGKQHKKTTSESRQKAKEAAERKFQHQTLVDTMSRQARQK